MKKATLYYNPACSKSRQALRLLEEHGYSINVIEYLKDMPDAATLHIWIDKHNIDPMQLVRTGEPEWQQTGISDVSANAEQIIEQLLRYPILLQRPVACIEDKVLIARPPEKLLDII